MADCGYICIKSLFGNNIYQKVFKYFLSAINKICDQEAFVFNSCVDNQLEILNSLLSTFILAFVLFILALE
jgi:hypothetical protein